MIEHNDLTINERTYKRCVRAFSFLEERLSLNIKLHQADNAIQSGQIFLFNHFARFETIVPQYLIFKETGAYCRTIASREFFRGNGGFAKFLLSIGGVPNDMKGLLPFLAAEILRGRKVVIFPEGGMIKDRRVIDAAGEFQIFSPTARELRKHHKGAAAIAVMLEIFKKRIRSVHKSGDGERLARWVQALGLEDEEALLAAAREPTAVVPANITFFPIRVEKNLLKRGAELFFRELRDHAKEELLIEGNILLTDTDMDIRLGKPLSPKIVWRWWERILLDRAFAPSDSLEQLFDLDASHDRWLDRLASSIVEQNTRRLRDQCMVEMYRQVTVNLAHIASRLILRLIERGVSRIAHEDFRKMVYLAVKLVQREPLVFAHESLSDPGIYSGILAGKCELLEEFLVLAGATGQLEDDGKVYRFLAKLSAGHTIHRVRLESTIQVYGNEIAGVPLACAAVERALEQATRAGRRTFAEFLFDDEIRDYSQCKQAYAQKRHLALNTAETATEPGEPYLLTPKTPKSLGIVLVHGFLASPAELRPLGEALYQRGHPVIGVRLSGHGTSPWDLRERSWQDWMASLERGYEIVSALAEEICIVGFSLGGCLALRLAAEAPAGLAGVVSVSAPVKLRNKNLAFVPMLHGANKLTGWTSALEGVMSFRLNESERPDINYRHIPISALYELRRAIDDLRRNLPKVGCPAAIIQGREDPVVDPKSAEIIFDKIQSSEKSLQWIEHQRHGLLGQDIDGSYQKIFSFLEALISGGQVEVKDRRKALPAAFPSGTRTAAP